MRHRLSGNSVQVRCLPAKPVAHGSREPAPTRPTNHAGGLGGAAPPVERSEAERRSAEHQGNHPHGHRRRRGNRARRPPTPSVRSCSWVRHGEGYWPDPDRYQRSWANREGAKRAKPGRVRSTSNPPAVTTHFSARPTTRHGPSELLQSSVRAGERVCPRNLCSGRSIQSGSPHHQGDRPGVHPRENCCPSDGGSPGMNPGSLGLIHSSMRGT